MVAAAFKFSWCSLWGRCRSTNKYKKLKTTLAASKFSYRSSVSVPDVLTATMSGCVLRCYRALSKTISARIAKEEKKEFKRTESMDARTLF